MGASPLGTGSLSRRIHRLWLIPAQPHSRDWEQPGTAATCTQPPQELCSISSWQALIRDAKMLWKCWCPTPQTACRFRVNLPSHPAFFLLLHSLRQAGSLEKAFLLHHQIHTELPRWAKGNLEDFSMPRVWFWVSAHSLTISTIGMGWAAPWITTPKLCKLEITQKKRKLCDNINRGNATRLSSSKDPKSSTLMNTSHFKLFDLNSTLKLLTVEIAELISGGLAGKVGMWKWVILCFEKCWNASLCLQKHPAIYTSLLQAPKTSRFLVGWVVRAGENPRDVDLASHV